MLAIYLIFEINDIRDYPAWMLQVDESTDDAFSVASRGRESDESVDLCEEVGVPRGVGRAALSYVVAIGDIARRGEMARGVRDDVFDIRARSSTLIGRRSRVDVLGKVSTDPCFVVDGRSLSVGLVIVRIESPNRPVVPCDASHVELKKVEHPSSGCEVALVA